MKLRLPENGGKVDYTLLDEWEPFYLRMFEIGLTLPVMDLVKLVLEWCQVHPSHFTPTTICILLCIDKIKEKWNLDFTVENLFFSYFIKHENVEIRHYVLNIRVKGRLVMLRFSSNKRTWKDKYFFVRGITCLGKSRSYPSCLRDSLNLIPFF